MENTDSSSLLESDHYGSEIMTCEDRHIVMIYKHCMVYRYRECKSIFGSYHPVYEHNSVHIDDIKKRPYFNLYYTNEITIQNQMWARYMDSNFVTRCWWDSQNVFSTRISFPRPVEEEPKRVSVIMNDRKQLDVIHYNGLQYNGHASGSKRRTYLSPDRTHVIKVALEPVAIGIHENLTEAQIYAENPNSIYAKCELIDNDWLLMEYVEPGCFSTDDNLPDWTLGIAEHQVGYNLDGKLVAYDYGSEI
jgi:hypothetical protein